MCIRDRYIVVSYNDCPFIRSLYGDFYILAFRRSNPLSQRAGATYDELITVSYTHLDVYKRQIMATL